MPSDPTDKDVAASRKKVDNLREKVEAARTELLTSEASRNNAVRKTQLDNQAGDLERELAALREQVKLSKDLPADDVLQPPEVSQPSADTK